MFTILVKLWDLIKEILESIPGRCNLIVVGTGFIIQLWRQKEFKDAIVHYKAMGATLEKAYKLASKNYVPNDICYLALFITMAISLVIVAIFLRKQKQLS